MARDEEAPIGRCQQATAPHAMAFTADTNVVADDVSANAVIEPESDDRIYYQTCSEYWGFSLAAGPADMLSHASGHAHRRASRKIGARERGR